MSVSFATLGALIMSATILDSPIARCTATQMMMNWLPAPSDFRGDLHAALEAPDAADRLEKLTALSRCRLGYLETIQLERALGRGSGEEAPGFARARLAILASSTVDHLVPAIRVAGLRRRLLIDVYVGSLRAIPAGAARRGSPLHRFGPQIVLFSLTAHEAIARRSADGHRGRGGRDPGSVHRRVARLSGARPGRP